MSQLPFLNRQTLYLRPNPKRVIVRPFKPATEPRDLNPTDKTRANHIVDRVLMLDEKTAAHQLADVLENFEGRHRNLATERGNREGNRHFAEEIVFFALKDDVLLYMNDDIKVPGWSTADSGFPVA